MLLKMAKKVLSQIHKSAVIMPMGGKATRMAPFTTEVLPKSLTPMVGYIPWVKAMIFGLSEDLGVQRMGFGTCGYDNFLKTWLYYRGGAGLMKEMQLSHDFRIDYQDPTYKDNGSASSVRHTIGRVPGLKDCNVPVIVGQPDDLIHMDNVYQAFKMALETSFDFIVVAVTKDQVENPEELGQLKVGDLNNGRYKAEEMYEKIAGIEGAMINVGWYVIKPSMWDKLEGDFAKDTIPGLVRKGRVGVYVCPPECPRYDLGKPEFNLKAVKCEVLNVGRLSYIRNFLKKFHTYFKLGDKNLIFRGTEKETRKAHKIFIKRMENKNDPLSIDGSVYMAKGVELGSEVRLANCALGDDVKIDSGLVEESNIWGSWNFIDVEIRNSLLGISGTAGKGFKCVNSIVGNDAEIGDNVKLVDERTNHAPRIGVKRFRRGRV